MSGCVGVSSLRLGIAFACVIGAGLSSTIGALLVLFVPTRKDIVLPAALAFAAGVMLYVSFIDIYAGKAVGHFEDAGYSPPTAFTLATICFLAGFPIAWVLDRFSTYIVYRAPARTQPPHTLAEQPSSDVEASSCITVGLTPSPPSAGGTASVESSERKFRASSPEQNHGSDMQKAAGPDGSESEEEQRSKRLVHMGLLAALAMALHNMPEGLVTFVGYMDSIQSGATTAIAIAIHNIPEGMVVASGVYFGTGRRWKALLWASVSAFSEPIGALIGLAVVCGGSLTDTVFGILFGLVAGIMVYISLKELLPNGRLYDPNDRVCTMCMIAGMIIMAASLVAIGYSQPSEEEATDAMVVEQDAAGLTAEGA